MFRKRVNSKLSKDFIIKSRMEASEKALSPLSIKVGIPNQFANQMFLCNVHNWVKGMIVSSLFVCLYREAPQ